MPPRRRVLDATPARTSPNASSVDVVLPDPSNTTYAANIQTLRRSWQWAAFSQFFYTFAQLLQMPEVTLSDVEDDLAHGSSLYLPRIMTRLLVAMSLDRKLTVSNWQTGFRKQCMKRGGSYNPLGPDPVSLSQNPTPEPENEVEEKATMKPNGGPYPPATSPSDAAEVIEEPGAPGVRGMNHENLASTGEDGVEPPASDSVKTERLEPQGATQPSKHSRDWTQLSMQEKLEALYTLTEWQFDNPHRLRQQMKDDGDHGLWRIEPIGYDSKTNAYWLIGPDRLWIQRALPKPPRPIKRKRPISPKQQKPKASTSKVIDVDSESEPEEPMLRKRTRTRTGAIRTSRSRAKTEVSEVSGRGTRAAKLKANKILDVQAKELAEFQRQAALLPSPSRAVRGNRSTRSGTGARTQPSPSKRPTLGTRASARLRGASQDSDDEWQQIPDDWLHEERDRAPLSPVRRTRNKGMGWDETQKRIQVPAADTPGLDSDSELTELSDDPQDNVERINGPSDQLSDPSEAQQPELPQATSRKLQAKDASVVKNIERSIEYLPVTEVPEGFVEWEAICVTLPEWEAIGERFVNATHYLEKALHKVLSQGIIPAVVAELRENERRRKVEEAVVHRKRSSRIAIKESEKELARAEALRRAEEEEKMSRTRRLEARAKKEEEEREKREQAREQRRKEREARERKIANRNAPKESSSEGSSEQPTPIPSTHPRDPSANGVAIPTSLKPGRKTTPNSIQTPDWILDCEVCGKNGINIDDGLPMVSCGSCGRWQHITCHDNVDRHKGLSKRNWTTQKFLCQKCSAVTSYRTTNGHQQYSSSQHSSVDGRTQRHTQKAPSTHGYTQPNTDMRYTQQPAYDIRGVHSGQHHAAQPSAMYSRSQSHQPGALPYSQYEQRGYSSYISHSPTSWQNGYSAISEGQQFTDVGSYNVSRATVPYTNAVPSPSYGNAREPQPFARGSEAQGYQRTPESQSYHRQSQSYALNGHWNHTVHGYNSAAGQRSASHISAAESLAFMQETTPGLQSWQAPGYAQRAPAHDVHHSGASPAPLHRSQPGLSLGHNPPFQFPAS